VTLPRARVIRAEDARTVQPLLAPGPGPVQRRRVAREEVLAHLAAERIEKTAKERAQQTLDDAEERGRQAVADATRVAVEAAGADLTARWLALRAAETTRMGTQAEQWVSLSVALAERLVGATLELHPDRISSLARGVLAEARGARRAVIDCHPIDAETLRKCLGDAGLPLDSVDVVADETLARGSLRLHTDLGTLDAQLAPRLDRLAAALRDVLA
jgi:flagellar biosynthesis/type III secretory pathway protein FliH